MAPSVLMEAHVRNPIHVTRSRLKYCSSLRGRCTMRYCWKHRSENFSVWIYPAFSARFAPIDTLSSLFHPEFHDILRPHRDRKVGINVNRMSARPRKTALQWCIKGSLFHSSSLAISTFENSSFSRHERIFFDCIPSFFFLSAVRRRPNLVVTR